MRKHAVAALTGVMVTTAVGLPNPAHAMSVGAQLGVLSATTPTQVQLRMVRPARLLEASLLSVSPPYAYYSYRPWPYYNYFFGSGWSSLWGISVTPRGRRRRQRQRFSRV